MDPNAVVPQARRRGRPAAAGPRLGREQIVAAALSALEGGRSDFSMRGLAAELRVDPMALYHYFPSKQALVEALIHHAFGALDNLPEAMAALPDKTKRLQCLAETYLQCIAPLPQLTRHLALQGGEPLAARFADLFERACGHPVKARSREALARDVLVDYLHGVALSGPATAARALVRGWPLLLMGLNDCL